MVTGTAPAGTLDHDKIRRGVRLLIEGMGDDPDRAGVRATPERVARMFDEVYGGLHIDPRDVVDVMFEEGHDELVLVRDIPLASMCEHHMVPFVGRAHVGYIPNTRGQVTGLSKLARLVEVVSRRPSLQERMTTIIADTLEEVLEPRGVLVIIEAEHLCMTMRGVRKPGSTTVTSAVRGRMRDDPRTRSEAMALATGRPLGAR
ncbi:MAG: GTP cyclohydrolase I FolE [Actinomycetota bacterium]|nr:GTP cyclohydrolase I FolE [Actinomycetota bacterium]